MHAGRAPIHSRAIQRYQVDPLAGKPVPDGLAQRCTGVYLRFVSISMRCTHEEGKLPGFSGRVRPGSLGECGPRPTNHMSTAGDTVAAEIPTSIKDGTENAISHLHAMIPLSNVSGVGMTGGRVGLKHDTVRPDESCGCSYERAPESHSGNVISPPTCILRYP